MKSVLRDYLKGEGHDVEDMGPKQFDPADDYPYFAYPVAKNVAERPDSVGILLCRSGQGVAMVANKVKGVRAALVWNTNMAAASREHNHANVLCLASDYIGVAGAKQIIDRWLKSELSQEERHLRRLQKVADIEKEN